MSDFARREAAGLRYAEWRPAGTPVVLALHGLTSTSEVWRGFADQLAHRVVAPDLPGRAGSVRAEAAPGLAGHAAAVTRLADELGLDDIILVGHSLGAYLAPLVAAALPDRVRRVVLLDGGVAPERRLLVRPPIVRFLFGRQVRVLTRCWPDVDSFVDAVEGAAVAGHPELRPRMREWAGYLLDGPPGALRARVDPQRLVGDAVDALTGAPTLTALADLEMPVHAIVAEHGRDDRAGPFLTDRALHQARVPRLSWARIPANHLTMLFHPACAEAAK